MGEIAMNLMPGAGITAFHGSPHKFTKFDMSKIGTGEGAQAYGHGLYFAENPKVATDYQKALSQGETTIAGKTYADDGTGYTLEGVLNSNKGDVGKAQKRANSMMEYYQKNIDKYAGQTDPHALGVIDSAGRSRAEWEALNNQLSDLAGKPMDFQKGNLYKVDIPDDQIAKMLDWNKPLSEQTESIKNLFPERFTEINRKTEQYLSSLSPQGRKVAESMMKDNSANLVNGKHDKNWNLLGTSDPNIDHNAIHDIGRLVDDLPSGGNLYHSIAADEAMPPFNSSKFSSGAVPASEYLRSKGIPGIKYLDQGSRGSGKGTSNFVLFSDEIAKILERNGQPIGDLAGTLSK
jgi:hypothetical protein